MIQLFLKLLLMVHHGLLPVSWPSPPENDEITPPDDVLENIIEDIEEAKNVDTEPVSEPKQADHEKVITFMYDFT